MIPACHLSIRSMHKTSW